MTGRRLRASLILCVDAGLPGAAVAWIWPPPAFVPSLPVDRLREGDLIFRIGTDWQSDAVSGAADRNDDDPCSHVGLIAGSPGHWQVLHSTPVERPEREDGVVLDDLAFFIVPERVRGVAVYRVEASATERAAAMRFAYSRLGAPLRPADDDTEGNSLSVSSRATPFRAAPAPVRIPTAGRPAVHPRLRGEYDTKLALVC